MNQVLGIQMVTVIVFLLLKIVFFVDFLGMMQGGNDMAEGMMSTEIIMVPNKMVGLIIGRGGEQITR